MAAVLPVDFDAPQLTPPPVSLLTAATVVDRTDPRSTAGLTFIPEGCAETVTVTLCANDELTPSPTGNAGAVEFLPFGIIASDRCSAFSANYRDYAARATRKLLARESYVIEQELWDETLGQGNPDLVTGAQDVTPGGTAVTLTRVLAELEQAIADCGNGRMMIHMRPWVFEALNAIAPQLLIKEGQRWTTPKGNIVVPGDGYAGTGPAGEAVGASEWIYATPLVTVVRWPLQVVPGDLASAMDRQTNDVAFWAERVVGYLWDTTCCHLALEVSRS